MFFDLLDYSSKCVNRLFSDSANVG
jgi:hypothetical protein